MISLSLLDMAPHADPSHTLQLANPKALAARGPHNPLKAGTGQVDSSALLSDEECKAKEESHLLKNRVSAETRPPPHSPERCTED